MRKYRYIKFLNDTKKGGFYEPPFSIHKQGVFVHKTKFIPNEDKFLAGNTFFLLI
jgi:hypothetical protein